MHTGDVQKQSQKLSEIGVGVTVTAGECVLEVPSFPRVVNNHPMRLRVIVPQKVQQAVQPNDTAMRAS